MSADQLAAMVASGGLLADPKGIWRGVDIDGVERWTL